ncbi:MAG: hypothetical protein ACI9OF_001557, partial [Saprospiraceae bacterium]
MGYETMAPAFAQHAEQRERPLLGSRGREG